MWRLLVLIFLFFLLQGRRAMLMAWASRSKSGIASK